MILLHLSYSRYKELAADRIGHCYVKIYKKR